MNKDAMIILTIFAPSVILIIAILIAWLKWEYKEAKRKKAVEEPAYTLEHFNYRTQQYDAIPLTERIDDYSDYIPQSSMAQHMYSTLVNHMDYSPAEAAIQVLLAILGDEL